MLIIYKNYTDPSPRPVASYCSTTVTPWLQPNVLSACSNVLQAFLSECSPYDKQIHFAYSFYLPHIEN